MFIRLFLKLFAIIPRYLDMIRRVLWIGFDPHIYLSGHTARAPPRSDSSAETRNGIHPRAVESAPRLCTDRRALLQRCPTAEMARYFLFRKTLENSTPEFIFTSHLSDENVTSLQLHFTTLGTSASGGAIRSYSSLATATCDKDHTYTSASTAVERV